MLYNRLEASLDRVLPKQKAVCSFKITTDLK